MEDPAITEKRVRINQIIATLQEQIDNAKESLKELDAAAKDSKKAK